MTTEQLKKCLEDYYGKHDNETVTTYVERYINSNFQQKDFRILLEAVLKTHSVNFGFPDIKAIEKASEKENIVKKISDKNVWKEQYKPLTDQERKQADKSRNEWMKICKEAAESNKQKQEDKGAKNE